MTISVATRPRFSWILVFCPIKKKNFITKHTKQSKHFHGLVLSLTVSVYLTENICLRRIGSLIQITLSVGPAISGKCIAGEKLKCDKWAERAWVCQYFWSFFLIFFDFLFLPKPLSNLTRIRGDVSLFRHTDYTVQSDGIMCPLLVTFIGLIAPVQNMKKHIWLTRYIWGKWETVSFIVQTTVLTVEIKRWSYKLEDLRLLHIHCVQGGRVHSKVWEPLDSPPSPLRRRVTLKELATSWGLVISLHAISPRRPTLQVEAALISQTEIWLNWWTHAGLILVQSGSTLCHGAFAVCSTLSRCTFTKLFPSLMILKIGYPFNWIQVSCSYPLLLCL